MVKPDLETIKKIISNNKILGEKFDSHQDTASRLTHWHKYENFEEWLDELLILNRDNCIALSNETSIDIHEYNYDNALEPSLSKDFEKAKIHYEYNFGAFELYQE